MQALPAGAGKDEQQWLLVANCTALGLANSLNLLSPRVRVEGVDAGTFRRKADEYQARLASFDLVLALPNLIEAQVVDFSEAAALKALPTPYFDAYHPDLCYLQNGSGMLKGVMGDYHSKVVTAAFQAGMSQGDALALFDGACFARFGYLDRWEGGRERMLREYAAAGLQLARRFSRWGDPGPFMHSVNHPAIRMLHDVARTLLEQQGIETVESHVLPHDNLLNGPIWPVYGEIADVLSVPGSYQFKPGGQWRCIDLQEFVAGSYAVLDAAGPDVQCAKPQRASFEQVRANL